MRSRVAIASFLLLVAPVIAEACPVCFGDPNSSMTKGVVNGVWVLLGVIGVVQLGFVALFFSFWKRGREMKKYRESLRVVEGGLQ